MLNCVHIMRYTVRASYWIMCTYQDSQSVHHAQLCANNEIHSLCITLNCGQILRLSLCTILNCVQLPRLTVCVSCSNVCKYCYFQSVHHAKFYVKLRFTFCTPCSTMCKYWDSRSVMIQSSLKDERQRGREASATTTSKYWLPFPYCSILECTLSSLSRSFCNT